MGFPTKISLLQRDQGLQLIEHIDTPGHCNRREYVLVFVDKFGLHMEDKVGTRKERLSIISPVEPFVRLEHANCGHVHEQHNIFRFVNDLERPVSRIPFFPNLLGVR
jgi:hypothetical protein